jgi:hypothetical protein
VNFRGHSAKQLLSKVEGDDSGQPATGSRISRRASSDTVRARRSSRAVWLGFWNCSRQVKRSPPVR